MTSRRESELRLGLAGETDQASGASVMIVACSAWSPGSAPIHDAVRNTLQRQGLTLADITVAHRVRQQRR
jgi:hypothetical protein